MAEPIPPDRVLIRDLRVRVLVGIFPEERRHKQDVVINLSLHADLRRAGRTDCIDDTVDYKAIKTRILSLVADRQYDLVEKLAADVAEICLATDDVEAVRVMVEKPGALRFTWSVGVEIFRTRQDPHGSDAAI